MEDRSEGLISVEKKLSTTYSVSPEIRQDIKDSLMVTIRTDRNLLKDALKELFVVDSEFLKSLVERTLITKAEEINTREVDEVTAREEIASYIKSHEGCLTSEIIENLNLDPIFVMKILKDMEKDIITSKPVE